MRGEGSKRGSLAHSAETLTAVSYSRASHVPTEAHTFPSRPVCLLSILPHCRYLSPEVQLRQLRARLAAGMAPAAASQILPVYVGGPVSKGPALRQVAPGPWVENDARQQLQ